MAFQEFHPFPRLPRELQYQIWEYAVLSLPQKPRAHFFTVYDDRKDAADMATRPFFPGTRFISCLTAPHCSGSKRLSWTDSNPSAYLSEIGLWGACGDSRYFMQKSLPFGAINWHDWCEKTQGSPHVDLIPARGTFNLDGQKSIFGIPIAALGLGHVALEYDPAWKIPWIDDYHEVEGPHRCFMDAASDRLPWVENLWFIDYRIQFYGNSCKFVEVQSGDSSWKLDGDPYIFTFLREMDYFVTEYFF
ncbi:hypothetical protein F5X99DRAFT_421842 [Biscogniauxia marginata]|nr:hypothetical protein F5X99DRAFT_421842 [Biscogniauxia marginata]